MQERGWKHTVLDSLRTALLPGRLAVLALGLMALLVVSCSDDSFIDLGGRSSGWIGEVATTNATTTTTAPTLIRAADTVDWVNDELGEVDEEVTADAVLADVFARSGDSSRFLQASREEIVAVVPEVAFPATVPVEVSHLTSQLVIESRVLQLADEPTVAFGMWSVEPYTRSRSVGQVAVLNVNTDPVGSEVANSDDTEATCAAYADGDRLCSLETIADHPVWRLEGESGVTHLWYRDEFRYELNGQADEEVVHTVIAAMTPLRELLESG